MMLDIAGNTRSGEQQSFDVAVTIAGTSRKVEPQSMDMALDIKGADNRGFENDIIVDDKSKNRTTTHDEGDLQRTNEDKQVTELEKASMDKVYRPKTPGGRYKWVVCFAVFMHFVLFEGVFFSFGLIFIELSECFDSGKSDTAWIISINIAASFCSGPFASVLCQSFGYWTVAIIGTLVACVGLLTSMQAGNISTLYVTYGLLGGIGNGMMYHTSVVCVTVAFSKRKSFANGLVVCGVGVGLFIVSLLAESFIKSYGWRGTVLIETGLLLNGIPVGLVLRPMRTLMWTVRTDAAAKPTVSTITSIGPGLKPDGKRPRVEVIETNTKAKCGYNTGTCNVYGPVGTLSFRKWCGQIRCNQSRSFSDTLGLSLLRRPEFLIFNVSSLLTFFALYMPFVFIPDLAKTKGIDSVRGAWLLSASGVVSTTFNLGFGFLADKPWVNRFVLQGTSLMLCGLFTSLMPVCDSFGLLLFDIALFSTFQGYIPTLMIVLAGDLVGTEKLSQGFGLSCWFAGCGSLMGPPIAGWFYDRSGNYNASFWTCGLVLAMAGVLTYITAFLRRRRQEEERIIKHVQSSHS